MEFYLEKKSFSVVDHLEVSSITRLRNSETEEVELVSFFSENIRVHLRNERGDELAELFPDGISYSDSVVREYVDIGDEVVLKDLDTNKDVKFSIVGQGEGDPLKNMVSSDSIVGKALVGKSVGDKVSIRLPVGKKRYEIVELN